MILFWRFLYSSWSKCSTFLSKLIPAHLSQQRSLSICLEVTNSSTYRVNFDLRPPRAGIASGSWVWNSNPFPTIQYAFRSWHVSRSHWSFSLLTLAPFSPMKWIHAAWLLSEMVKWLAGIPESIIHQELHCLLQRRAGAQVYFPSPNPSFPSSHPTFFVSCARLQPL